MRLLMPPLLVTVLTAAWLLSVPASNAQAPSTPDQKLDAAAAAIERVANLKENYQQQIASAPPSDRERIAAEAISALSKAVTDQGLSIDEYNSTLEVAQNDPEVGAKIRQPLDPSAK